MRESGDLDFPVPLGHTEIDNQEPVMTVKPTISLTDQGYVFAKSLVDSGRFASISAVLQHGLRLLEQEEAEYHARLDAIRADLDRRAVEPSLSTDEMDKRLAAWRAERDARDPLDLA